MTFVDAKVEVQGESLVVMDEESGDCLLVDVWDCVDKNPHTDSPSYPYDRMANIFGDEVLGE